MGNPENIVTRNIRKVLKDSKVWHFKHKASLGSKKGVSDILGIRTVKVADLVAEGIEEVGIFVAIEVKKEGVTKGSPDQERFIADVRQRGGIGFVTDNIVDVIRFLGLAKRVTPLIPNYFKKEAESGIRQSNS